MGARNEAVKDRCMEIYKKEKRKVKRFIFLNIKKVRE